MERKRELSLLYDRTSSLYDRRYSGIQLGKYLRLLPHLPGEGRVLDVGCGTGLFLERLGKGCEAVGLDLSPGMLRRARKRNPGVPLILGDAEHLPFRAGSFSAVFSFTVLQNLPHPLLALREMARVVRAGGKVVVSTLRHKHGAEVRGWMEEAGLKVVEEGEEGEDLFFVGEKLRGSGGPSPSGPPASPSSGSLPPASCCGRPSPRSPLPPSRPRSRRASSSRASP